MKITNRFLVLFLTSLSVSSCAKDYTCICVTTFENVQTDAQTEIHTVHGNKLDAKNNCYFHQWFGGYATKTCTIK